MIVSEVFNGGGFLFKVENGEKTYFKYQIGDLSALYGNAKHEKIDRGNSRQCKKYLSNNELNEFCIALKSGDFDIREPILTRERTKEEIEKYCKPQNGCEFKGDVARVDIEIVLPPGGAIYVYSVRSSYEAYIYNEGGKFHLTSDYKKVADVTSIYF